MPFACAVTGSGQDKECPLLTGKCPTPAGDDAQFVAQMVAVGFRAQPMDGRRPFPVIRFHASTGASTALD
jgi:hypothetical protein